MIIKNVRLKPFGGIGNREIEFKPGLNIIEGPNEAGKSTVFWAIQRALFTPVKLHKRHFEKEIEKFLPIGGGDTVHVEIQFSHKEQIYKLKRTWGATQHAEMRMPDGSVITDDESISERLGAFLPASEGTFKSVLMTYQSGLEMTLDDLEEHPETIHTLGDLLRKVVMETDGVSVDGFKSRIQSQYDEYFSRWDRDRNYPESGRGINNPWKREIGFILDAFYEKEKTRVSLENACRYEEELDKLSQLIAEAAKKVSEKEEYVKSNKKAVEDARERRTLSAELRALKISIEEIKKINSEWPVLESQVEAIKKVIPELKKKEKELLNEQAQAELMEKNKTLFEKFKRINEKKKALDDAEKQLKKVKKLTGVDLDGIKSATTELGRLRASIKAGKLAVSFKAKTNLNITIQEDLEGEIQKEIIADESLRYEAGGRIRLEHRDWLMEVTSGEGDFDKIRKNYKAAEGSLTELFKEHEVETLEKAVDINREYEKYLKEVEKTRENYKDELGEDSYEGLESQIRSLGEIKETRSLAMIATELANIRYELKAKSEEVEEKQKIREGFKGKYGDTNKLIIKLAEEMGKEKEIQGKIEGLAPLPEGVEDAERYIRDYEEKQEGLEGDRESKNNLEIKRAELDEPGESSEELERQLKDKVERFKAVLKKGGAIVRIKDMTEKILEDMDIGTYKELEKDLEKYTAAITENRYSNVEMEEGLPQGFVRTDGEVVFYRLLSHGTKDVLGLALRLSMANHFLRGAEGFFAMDDPLVNLDPGRQRQAAEIIKVYANEKQVLVFTCHPANAVLLRGNKITL